jgi:TrmH family RNA methyltransferase
MESWKDNICFILVEPKEPGNIGAAARAMKNMGFRKLEMVRPGDFLSNEAREMACSSSDLLESAKIYPKFSDALRDKNLVIGTTRRPGRHRGIIVPLKESIGKILAASRKNRVAILFGRERTGLTNQEGARCGFLINIPSDLSSPSLNLAQSVMLVAYELSQKRFKAKSPELVKHEKLETLFRHIESTLRLLEYSPRGNSDLEKSIMRNLKHFIGRAGLTEYEMKMIHGLCTQVERRMKNRKLKNVSLK